MNKCRLTNILPFTHLCPVCAVARLALAQPDARLFVVMETAQRSLLLNR